MQLLISDTNVLIDMEEGQVVEVMFQLPFQFAVPDILYHEELEDEHSDLIDLGLQIVTLSAETLIDVSRLTAIYQKPSRNDCFALALAQQEECALLTGDADLRKAAENELLDVHGTLWIVEQLIRQKLLSFKDARLAYDNMQQAARRLPWTTAESELIKIEQELNNNQTTI